MKHKIFFIILLIFIPVYGISQPINFENIKNFALFSQKAYETESSVKSFLDSKGYELKKINEIPRLRVSYYLAMERKTGNMIVAARGTDNVENVAIDLDLKLENDPFLSIYLHKGFGEAARVIFYDMRNYLDKNSTVDVTGHSLGGAIALILSVYLDKNDYKVGNVVTFGQPKVTNVKGTDIFKNIKVLRVVTEHDMVPLVPPLDPMDINNLDIFWHTGVELILLDGNKYSITSGIKSMMRATKFFKKVPDETNLKYHKMEIYLDLIEKKLIGSEKVPYKSDFKLLDMF